MMKLSNIIPVGDDAIDAVDRARIVEFVEYAARKGDDFEQMVSEKEALNPQFDFLRGGSHSSFYNWRLLCRRRGYSGEQVDQIVKDFGVHIISNSSPSGRFDLTDKDRANLFKMLLKNDGSKQSIQQLRQFVVERAHSFVSIGRIFYSYSKTISPSRFQHALHTLYVLNDIIFHCGETTMSGVYTASIAACRHLPVDFLRAVWPSLLLIMAKFDALAKLALAGDAITNSAKLLKLAELWHLKDKISYEQLIELTAALSGSMALEEPGADESPLISPYCPASIFPAADSLVSSVPVPATSVGGQPSAVTTTMMSAGASSARLQSTGPVYSQTAPSVDLLTVPVGVLASMAQASRRLGRKPYHPLDPSVTALAPAPHVEPARQEARLSDFYSKLNQLTHPKTASSAANVRAADFNSDAAGAVARSDRMRTRVQEEEDDGRVRSKRSNNYAAAHKHARMEALQTMQAERTGGPALAADNIGHAMLAGLGWEEGRGLGAAGTGLKAPIQAVVKKDKAGIGSSNTRR